MWLTGAILLLKRWAVGTFHSFPGVWTAALPLLPATWGLVVMLREVRGAAAPKP